MAGTIKGITIEIDGKVGPLKKSLADANKSIKDTQKQLRDVNKLLKLDPKNTELLKQKQELLNKSVKEVNEKLKAEKDALKQLKEADQTDEVKAQMEKLERQIVEDEAALKKAKKELKDFGDVGKQQAKAVNDEWAKAGKKLEEVGCKVKGAGDSLTKNVTAPIVATGAAAMAAFNEVDAGYDVVIQKTGATGQAAQEMYDIVDQLATSIPTDFATAGEAVGEVNTRFGLTGEALQELSEKFIMFAQLNNTDVTSSVDSVQKALSAYGLTAEDAGALLDRLNKTGQETGVSVDTLTAGLIQNGTAFQELGLNIDQSVALMGEMEKSGANSETVMQGLRKALKSAAKDGKPLNQALTELQDTIENGKDGMDGLTAAYELFGKSGDQIYGAVKNGSLDFRNLGKDASDAAGSVAGTFEETLDPIDQWQTTLNQLKLTGAELGATIGQILQPVLERVAEVAQSLREKWEELSPAQQNMIVEIAGIVAVVGPIVAIIGSIITGIGGLIMAITTVAGVLGVAASTVGIVIAAITAIIAIIVLCITHWDQIKAKVSEVTTAIKDYVTQLKEKVQQKFEEIKQQISQKIDAVKSDMSSKWNQIKSDVANKVSGIKSDVVAKWEQIKSDVGNKVVSMKNDVIGKINEWKSSITEKLNDIKSKFTEKFDDIKSKVKGVVDDIKGFFEGMKLKIPKPELPALPHFSLSGEFSLNPPSVPHLSVDWYAKAMNQPFMFTKPTVMATPYGAIGAGEAGHEIMYGKQALMRDIANASAANNANLIDGFYRAMVAALKTADFTVDINGREFKRAIREVGVKA